MSARAVETSAERYARLRREADQLDAATSEVARTWRARNTAEAELDEHRQEPLVRGAVRAHEEAVAARNRAQAAADELPEAREQAIADLTGPAADETHRLLAAADELAAAIHTASRAYQATAGVGGTTSSPTSPCINASTRHSTAWSVCRRASSRSRRRWENAATLCSCRSTLSSQPRPARDVRR